MACHIPDGYNLEVNMGDVAGQTLFHFHLSLILHYRGDVARARGGHAWLDSPQAGLLTMRNHDRLFFQVSTWRRTARTITG